MSKRNQPILHGGKPTAQRHAERLARNAKHRDAHRRWADRDGKFTVPHNKEK